MVTTVTSKGQITIPKDVLDALDIHPGTQIEVQMTGNGEAVLRKIGSRDLRPDRFDRAVGAAEVKWEGTTDEYMELIRGYKDDPPV